MSQNNLKVLIVSTVPTEKSGIPMVIFNLLEVMDKTDMHIGYVSINDPSKEFKDKLRSLNVDLYIVPRLITKPLEYVRKLYAIARDYDVMHVHGNSATMVLEMIAARIAGVKVRAAHSHNTSCRMKWIDRLSRPLFHILCNARLACGKEAGKWLFGKKDFTVISNGIDTSRFRFNNEIRDEFRTRLSIQGKHVIGHIGNFLDAKNHKFLIEFFSKVNSMLPDARLILLGDGPLRQSIEDLLQDLGVKERVIVCGSVNNPSDYMQAMDMIVMPSLYEGFPLTLVEEQANGLPILAADTITPEADITGLIEFKSLDDGTDKWAEVAIGILKNKKDRSSESEKAIINIQKNGYDINTAAYKLKSFFKLKLNEK